MAKLNEFNLCDYIQVVKFIYSMNLFLSKYLGCGIVSLFNYACISGIIKVVVLFFNFKIHFK